MMTPALWIPAGLALLAAVSRMLPGRHQSWPIRIAIAYLVAGLITQGLGFWHSADALGAWFFVTVAVFSIFGLWYSGPYIAREASAHGWPEVRLQTYYSLIFLFIAALTAVALWSNFLWLWLAIEAATLSSVVLVAVPQTGSALEAAWKYVLVTEAGGFIALIGTVLALSAIHYPLWGWGWQEPVRETSITYPWALIGAYLALAGYGAKAGLVPFHTWLPDAHSEAPAPVSGLLSGLKLAGALLIAYRLFAAVGRIVPVALLHEALIVLGLASLLLAAAFVVFQHDLKRLFAYSSIEHIGLISLGMGFGGIALVGAALHIWTHAASKTLLFHNAGTVRLLYHTSSHRGGARGILQRTPWTGALLALGSAAIVGLPPLAPFWSEWLILAGGFHVAADRPFALIAAGLLIAIFVAIARILPRWLFTPGRSDQPRAPIAEPSALILPSLVLAVLVVGGGIAMPLTAHTLWSHLVHQLALTGGRRKMG